MVTLELDVTTPQPLAPAIVFVTVYVPDVLVAKFI